MPCCGFFTITRRGGVEILSAGEEVEVTESVGSGARRSLVHTGDAPPVERSDPGTEFCVDIVVKGRKTEVPERFRKHVAEKLKLEKIQKLDGKVISLDVEVSKEPNPRQADRCDRVEITLRSRGPVIRAEAAASDPYAALDLAAEKLDARLRKEHDKRHTRRGARRLTAAEVADHVPGAATLNGNGQAVHEEESDGVPTKKIGSLEIK